MRLFPKVNSLDKKELLKSTNDCLESITSLTVFTENEVVKQLQKFQKQLGDSTFTSSDEEPLIECLKEGQKLLNNLRLAKEAVSYTVSKMTATNRRPINLRDNTQLELSRQRFNNTELTTTFGFFKHKREELAQQSQRNMDFEQTAYRKGTGFNMAMWYRYAHATKSTKTWGNCTEQSNTAFVYLYTRVREALSLGAPSPFSSLQRIDVDNDLGGHSYILIDGMDKSLFLTMKTFTGKELLNLIPKLSSTAVVVDPWNSDHPFYPAKDIPKLMPECGLNGKMNIEFRLGFSAPEESEIKARL